MQNVICDAHVPLDEQRRIVALDGLQAKVKALRGVQSQSQEELDALRPAGVGVQGRVVKGDLTPVPSPLGEGWGEVGLSVRAKVTSSPLG